MLCVYKLFSINITSCITLVSILFAGLNRRRRIDACAIFNSFIFDHESCFALAVVCLVDAILIFSMRGYEVKRLISFIHAFIFFFVVDWIFLLLGCLVRMFVCLFVCFCIVLNDSKTFHARGLQQFVGDHRHMFRRHDSAEP